MADEVKSSNVLSLGYDANARRLTVSFHGGSVYAYDGVGPELYERLRTAPSVGKYLHSQIVPHYRATQMRKGLGVKRKAEG